MRGKFANCETKLYRAGLDRFEDHHLKKQPIKPDRLTQKISETPRRIEKTMNIGRDVFVGHPLRQP
jgi:hypothetical protein